LIKQEGRKRRISRGGNNGGRVLTLNCSERKACSGKPKDRIREGKEEEVDERSVSARIGKGGRKWIRNKKTLEVRRKFIIMQTKDMITSSFLEVWGEGKYRNEEGGEKKTGKTRKGIGKLEGIIISSGTIGTCSGWEGT